MKKILLPALLAMALIVPAQAIAKKPKHYSGTATPAGKIGFTVTQKKGSKQKNVGKFSFSGIPVACDEGALTARGFVSFTVKLNKGAFKINASNSSTGATLKVQGTLKAGTIRVSGPVALDGGGTGTNCESGTLSWTAARG